MLQHIVVARNQLLITFAGNSGNDAEEVKIRWLPRSKDAATTELGHALSVETRNQGLIQSVVRAHAWMRTLCDGAAESIEQLAEGVGLHPKVVRQALRLAFLSPEVTSAILEGRQPEGLTLARIPKMLPLSWIDQRPPLG